VKYGGTVAACGLAQGMDLPGSVAPFILRGVTLAGVDSVYAPMPRRLLAWERLARELPAEVLEANTETIALDAVAALAPRLLAGQERGRVRVDLAL
jgi:acrylyl-CoA reductase (NADPH)